MKSCSPVRVYCDRLQRGAVSPRRRVRSRVRGLKGHSDGHGTGHSSQYFATRTLGFSHSAIVAVRHTSCSARIISGRPIRVVRTAHHSLKIPTPYRTAAGPLPFRFTPVTLCALILLCSLRKKTNSLFHATDPNMPSIVRLAIASALAATALAHVDINYPLVRPALFSPFHSLIPLSATGSMDRRGGA